MRSRKSSSAPSVSARRHRPNEGRKVSEPERDNVAEYSVSELSNALKRTLEDG